MFCSTELTASVELVVRLILPRLILLLDAYRSVPHHADGMAAMLSLFASAPVSRDKSSSAVASCMMDAVKLALLTACGR